MSSSNSKSVSTSIPVFTGANYAAWWPSMMAYLQSTSCMWIAKFKEPVLEDSSTKDDCDFFIAWTKANDTIAGPLRTPSLTPSNLSTKPSRTPRPSSGF